MEPQPFTVTLQSKAATHVEFRGGDTLVLSHRLPRGFVFGTQHWVKLILVAGGKPEDEPLLIYASFADPQAFNAEFRPLLGSSLTASNAFIPLAGNFLPASVTLTVQTLSGGPLRLLPSSLTFGLLVSPLNWLRSFSAPPARPRPLVDSSSSDSEPSTFLPLLRRQAGGF